MMICLNPPIGDTIIKATPSMIQTWNMLTSVGQNDKKMCKMDEK